MKKLYLYLISFMLCHFLGSCKSAQHAGKDDNIVVSKEDFKQLNDSLSKRFKAVILSEAVDVRINSLPGGLPWTIDDEPYADDRAWETTVEDKIQLLDNQINDEPFTIIDYFYPRRVRWNLMKQCNMWLYSLDKNGEIKKRKIKKNEITYERLNDSIGRMRFDIHENVAGKILVRKYTLINPYYTMIRPNPDLQEFAKITPWIFQKEIPLLYGKYEIGLPVDDYDYPFIKHEAIKLGDGEINIKIDSGISKIRCVVYLIRREESGHNNHMRTVREQVYGTYDAEVITATVSNVMPLPRGSDAQLLGVEIIHLGSTTPQ